MVKETKKFFKTVVLEKNEEKSVTNYAICKDNAVILASY